MKELKRRFGELVRFDGSPHDRFGTGESSCLMDMVDDAAGRNYAVFFPHETTEAGHVGVEAAG